VVEDAGVEDDAALDTREYLVLLGLVSAAISWRKDSSSCSAISSRLRGFEAGGFGAVCRGSWNAGAACDGNEAAPPCSGAASELVKGHTIIVSVHRGFTEVDEAEFRFVDQSWEKFHRNGD